MTQPPTRRVPSGSGHAYYLDDRKTLGVTTAISEGYPKPGLVGWAGKATAAYAVDHWDELAEMGIASRLGTLERSRFLERDAAANRGTEVHTLALKLAAGEEVEVPEELVGHVDSYLKFTEEWRVRDRLVEAVVVNRRWRYMGTLDLIADLLDGQRWLIDIKTNKSGVFAESALQLAGYRHAETYIGSDEQERPLPEVAHCGVLWLRADDYDLLPIRAGDEEFRLFLYALAIAQWREVNDNYKRKDLCVVIGDALSPPSEVAA